MGPRTWQGCPFGLVVPSRPVAQVFMVSVGLVVGFPFDSPYRNIKGPILRAQKVDVPLSNPGESRLSFVLGFLGKQRATPAWWF